MYQRFLSVFVGMFFCMFLNAQVSEQFTSTSIPSSWEGEKSKFTIKEGKLCSSDEEAGSAYLSTNCNVAYDGLWESEINMEFTPNGSNYARFYLMSDSPVLNDALNGYYIQLGNADKQIVLYRIKGSSTKILGKSPVNRINQNPCKVSLKVVRNKDLEFSVFSKVNDESQFTEEFAVQDTLFKSSKFTGVYCKYAKSNASKFSFDNIRIDGKGDDDIEVPFVSVFSPSDTAIKVAFNEWIDESSLNISFSPNVPHELEWSKTKKEIIIRLQEGLSKGEKYTLYLSNLKDYVGNTGNDTLFTLAKTEPISTGDILFTEVMFNPQTGGSEFVEILNCSDKVLDLSELRFSTRKSADSSLYSSKKIADEQCLIFPNEIKVLTNDVEGVTQFHKCEEVSFIKMSSFPSLRNETGAIVLFRSSDSLIVDNFYYESSMHLESVPNAGKGVSLERQSIYGNQWSSCPEAEGYATPGYAIGILDKYSSSKDHFLSSEVCYPYKGHDQTFHLKYIFDRNNYQATMRIYSISGEPIRTVINNITLASEGEIVWDGTDENHNIVKAGPYVVRFDAIHTTSGKRITYTSVVLVSL